MFDIVRSISQTNFFEPPSSCDPQLWDIIKKMLTFDPKKRITIHEIMKHPYFLNAPENKGNVFDMKDFANTKCDVDLEKSTINHVKGIVVEGNLDSLKSQLKEYFDCKNGLYGR